MGPVFKISLPDYVSRNLPTIEELEAELAGTDIGEANDSSNKKFKARNPFNLYSEIKDFAS